MQPSDQHIIDALLAKDGQVTHDFFYVWCRPLLFSLVRKIFHHEVDYDEVVNDLYLHLMENDGRRLRTFKGSSSIYQWLKCVATRFFLDKRDSSAVIDDDPADPLYPMDIPVDEPDSAGEDSRRLLDSLENSRYRLVLRRWLFEGAEYEEIATELGTTVANVYNIKSRAMKEFTALVLKEYGNG